MQSNVHLAAWFLGMASLTGQVPQFAAFPLPGFAAPLASDFEAGDFDGDGDLDLTVVSALGPRLYENAGSGTLIDVTGALPPMPGNQRAATFVDIDRDGRSELLCTWTSLARLFRWQAGAWTDITANLPTGLATIHGVAAGDIDGDGDQDLVCAGSWLDFGQDQLLINDGAGVFTLALPFTGLSLQVVLADVDADQDLDVLFARPGVHLWRNDGGSFTNVTATNLPSGLVTPTWLAAGDVDGDGTIDLFVGANASGDRFLTNDGTGHFALATGLPSGLGSTSNSALVDVDDDGDLDLWRGTLNYGVPTLLLNDGAAIFTNTPSRLPPLNAWASQCDAVDLDRDGDPELLLGGLGVHPTVLWNLHRHVASPVAPTPGLDWHIEVTNQPGYGLLPRFSLLGIALARLPHAQALPPLGDLWLDLAAPALFAPIAFQPLDGPQTVTIAVPPMTGLSGLQLFVQGVIGEAPFPRFTGLVATAIQ